MAVTHPTPTPEANRRPRHVAIIMDGNGRWAKARGLPRTAGHRKGAECVRTIIRAAVEAGVEVLTLYGFSSENWRRSPDEVGDLMGLLRFYLRNEVSNLHKEGVQLRIIGDRDRLGPDIVKLIQDAEQLTADNRTITVVIALSYGGRAEIARAAQLLAEAVRDGKLDPADISEEAVTGALYTSDLPDPDLVIRTSGERRVSNFLIWQSAYAEFIFTETLWPDFGRDAFFAALEDYAGRDRRFGGSRA